LRRLVDSGVPGVSCSIGNKTETLLEGAFGSRVIVSTIESLSVRQPVY